VSVWEHKTGTTAHPWYGIRKKSVTWDSQFTGEFWILKELFRHVEPIHQVKMNLVFKKHAGTEKFPLVAEREGTTRTDEQLEHWRWSTINELWAIDEAVERYNQTVKAGNMTTEQAAAIYFPQRGTRTGRCTAYRGCPYQLLCKMAGHEKQAMGGFRPCSNEELVSLREWAG